MAVIDTIALLQLPCWKGEDEADAAIWLTNFKTVTLGVSDDDLLMSRAFKVRLAPGSDAEVWYSTLPSATTSSWSLLEREFERRWPREPRVTLTAGEKMDRFKSHVLKENVVGRYVEMEFGGRLGTHARWARLHKTYGRSTGETDAWLIRETRENLLP